MERARKPLSLSSNDPEPSFKESRRRKIRRLLTSPLSGGTSASSPDQKFTRGRSPLYSSSPRDPEPPLEESRRQKIRRRVTQLAKNIVTKPIQFAAPDAVLAVLADATANAVDMAVEDLVQRRSGQLTAGQLPTGPFVMNTTAVIEDTFSPLEASLVEMEEALQHARASLDNAKMVARKTLEESMAQSIAQALEGAVAAVEQAEQDASRKVLADIYATTVDNTISSTIDISSLAFEDVDYGTSEMAPPFLDEDQCLVPGEPVVRVEKAPENSRRIFAGIDIMASVDDVWNCLTDYAHLQDVVPNLVVNEVLEEYKAAPEAKVDTNLPEDKQCRVLADQMKGAKLRQVGGARVAGIRFSARTTLEVREWPQGLPDFAHYLDEVWDGKSRDDRANVATEIPLQRYKFPRPFAVSSLPTRDISMQSVVGDDGEFRLYQGVWRMQPLVGCVPDGLEAMRLTYAVEISPRAYLPVQLIEGRIARDLCTNLLAIRDFVSKEEKTLTNAQRTMTSKS